MPEKIRNALYLTIDFPPMPGGMSRHSADVCAALERSGFSATVVAPGLGDKSVLRDSPAVHRLRSVKEGHIFDNYALSVSAFFFSGLRLCLASRPAFVAANTWSICGVAAFLIKKLTGIPYIVFSHGLDVYAPRTNARAARLMKTVLENASAVIANSNFTKDLVEKAAGAARTAVLNPAVDAKIFERNPDVAMKNISGEKMILTVARLVDSKGHDLVIRSMPKILRRFPGAKYFIVGSGPSEEKLKKISSALGVSGHIVFAGYADQKDLASYYGACDVFVMASREISERGEVEGFGIAFLEAGVFGKPVVGSRTGGISDAVEDGVTGLLVGAEDPESVADAVIRILSDAGLARRLGEGGRTRAENEFGPDRFCVGLKRIINGISA